MLAGTQFIGKCVGQLLNLKKFNTMKLFSEKLP